jgi:hypothetical protein
MAVTTRGLPLPELDYSATTLAATANCRRHITSDAGRALEILGHAIEYLTDEYLHDAAEISAHDPHVQAVQILMALNRQIYYACPLEPAFLDKLRTFFHRASS